MAKCEMLQNRAHKDWAAYSRASEKLRAAERRIGSVQRFGSRVTPRKVHKANVALDQAISNLTSAKARLLRTLNAAAKCSK